MSMTALLLCLALSTAAESISMTIYLYIKAQALAVLLEMLDHSVYLTVTNFACTKDCHTVLFLLLALLQCL